MFKSRKADAKKASRSLTPPKSPKVHTKLVELLHECGVEEYVPSLQSIGVVAIDDLIRCSDEIILALVGDRVVHHRKLKEVVNAVKSAPKNMEGVSQIKVGAMLQAELESPRTPHSPTGRNLEQLPKADLIKLINEQKKLVMNHQEELICLHTKLEKEVKLRQKIQQQVDGYKNNEAVLKKKIDELSAQIIAKRKPFIEPETPKLELDLSQRKNKSFGTEPDTPFTPHTPFTPDTPNEEPEPETPVDIQRINSHKKSTSSSSLTSNKSPKASSPPANSTAQRHSTSSLNGGKKVVSPRPAAHSPPRFKAGGARHDPKKSSDSVKGTAAKHKRSGSGSFNKNGRTNEKKPVNSGISKDTPKANGRTKSPKRTNSPSRPSPTKPELNNNLRSTSNSGSHADSMDQTNLQKQSSQEGDLNNEDEDVPPAPPTLEEKMLNKSSPRSPLRTRVKAPPSLDTGKLKASSPRMIEGKRSSVSSPRADASMFKPKTNSAKESTFSSKSPKGSTPSNRKMSSSMPRPSEPHHIEASRKTGSWNQGGKNSLGDDTLESKIMRNATQEMSFEEKLLFEHKQKNSLNERARKKPIEKQESLEDKVITAAYDKWITVSDAEAFKGSGNMVHLYFEGDEDRAARISSHEVNIENDGMVKELREVKQEEERVKGVSNFRRWIKDKKFTDLILCGRMDGITPSTDPTQSTYLLPMMIAPGDDFSVHVRAFVRRADVSAFRQCWGKIAQEKQIKICLYAVPDRLTPAQASLYVFSRTQANAMAFLSNSLVDAFTPQTSSLHGRLSTCSVPDGCHKYVFLPAVSSMIRPLADESAVNELQDTTILHSPSS